MASLLCLHPLDQFRKLLPCPAEIIQEDSVVIFKRGDVGRCSILFFLGVCQIPIGAQAFPEISSRHVFIGYNNEPLTLPYGSVGRRRVLIPLAGESVTAEIDRLLSNYIR